MKAHRFNASRARQRSVVLQLEALEDRWCPAIIKISGALLQVIGDGAADTIAVRDNGSGGIAVQVTSPKGNSSASASGIAKVEIDAGDGNDLINYTLTNALATARALKICGDKGNDVVNLDFSAGITAAALDIDLDAGAGNDQIGMKFGVISKNAVVNLTECLGKGVTSDTLDFSAGIVGSKVNVDVNAGQGTDTVITKFGDIKCSDFLFAACLGKQNQNFSATLNGEISGTIPVRFDIDTGGGKDTVGFLGTGTIDAGATLAVDMGACMGSKNMTIGYDGVVKGTLKTSARLGDNAGTVTENVTAEAGSTGNVYARVLGSPGNDNLTLNVFDLSGGPGGKSTLAAVDAFIDGNGGTDVIVHTPNVRVKK